MMTSGRFRQICEEPPTIQEIMSVLPNQHLTSTTLAFLGSDSTTKSPLGTVLVWGIKNIKNVKHTKLDEVYHYATPTGVTMANGLRNIALDEAMDLLENWYKRRRVVASPTVMRMVFSQRSSCISSVVGFTEKAVLQTTSNIAEQYLAPYTSKSLYTLVAERRTNKEEYTFTSKGKEALYKLLLLRQWILNSKHLALTVTPSHLIAEIVDKMLEFVINTEL